MLLLDTHAAIWMVEDVPMTTPSRAAIRAALQAWELLVSPVSAWEIGLLASTRRQPLAFLPSPGLWFARLLQTPGLRSTPLTPGAAVAASFLPGELHRDPADRLLIATARELDAAIVTRDRMILAYAEQGHVRVVAC